MAVHKSNVATHITHDSIMTSTPSTRPGSLVDLRAGKATKAKKRLGKSVRLDVVRLIETPDDAGAPAPPSRVVIKLPRYDYDEIIDALEGEEDDAADSDAGEDYELAG